METEKPIPPEYLPPQELSKQPEKKEDESGEAWIERTIEIPELGTFFFREKLVKFSEKLEKETGGVKGYIRREFDWGQFGKLFGLTPEESLDFIEQQIAESEWEKGLQAKWKKCNSDPEFKESWSDWQEKERENFRRELGFTKTYTVNHGEAIQYADQILRNLTQGNFPDQCYFHVINGAWKMKGMESEYRNNLLMQKPYDPHEDWKKSDAIVSFLEIDRETDQPIRRRDLKEIDPNSADYQRCYYVDGKGLSVTYRGGGVGMAIKSLKNYFWKHTYGFGLRNKAFQRYLERANDLLPQIGRQMAAAQRSENSWQPEEWKLFQDASKNIEPMQRGEYGHVYRGISGSESGHPFIPIILNHPSIPEMRWCYADYAVLPTRKGWNVIEMITD